MASLYMSVCSLCSLCFLLVLNVAVGGHDEGVLSATGKVEVSDAGRNAIHQMRSEAADRHVQIGPHGSLAAVGASSASSSSAPSNQRNSTTYHEDALIEQKAKIKRSGGPKLTGYENSDCGGKQLGSYVLPLGADMTQDHCLEVRDAETDNPAGRIKISCDASGVAKACIWHQPNDTSCELAEPFCLNIQAVDTGLAAGGTCIPVKEHPTEKDTFARFTDFPPDTKWPDCLVPPISQSLMLMTIVGGVCSGVVILAMIWYCCLALPSPKHMDEGKGKGKGKGWGAEQAHEPLDEEQMKAIAATLPGMPPVLQPPADKGGKGDPMKGKGGFKGDPHMKGGMKGPPGKGPPGWGK